MLEHSRFSRAWRWALCRSRLALAILLLAFASLLPAAESASFQFAWLSDTHVGSETGEEDLRATVRDINSLTGLSFVVISGDITEYGSGEQLRLARDILGGIKIPCHVVPGNHDTKWSESGATDFARIWKEDRFVFDHGGFRFIAMHEGPVMKMADGHWAPQDVRWLADTLKKSQDRPVVFITHYPIDDGIANWYIVLDLLKKYNTQVALCGHIHRYKQESFEGVPGVMGRANLRNTAPEGGYTLVEVKDNQMLFSERTAGRNKEPWHKVKLQRHDYAAATNHYARPDFSVNSRYPDIKEFWSVDTGYTIASSPAVWKELAIVGDASGVVRALTLKSGQEQWKFETGGAVYSTPEVSGNMVILASTDGNVYALDAANGMERWRYKTDRPIVASPRVADNTVYIGSSERKFRALSLATGKLLWEFDGLGGFVETRPLIYNDKVIFGAWDQNLYALDAKTGELVWKWRGDRRGVLFSPAACWPVAANGKVFVVAPDRNMTAINAKTGEQLWRTSDYTVRESIGVSADQSRLYVRAMQDFVYAVSTSSAQPQKLWEQKPGFGYDINSGMLIERDGVVFYGTKNGLLLALDGKTGAIRWEHKVGVGVVNTVVPLGPDRVLATDFDGRVVVVGRN